MTQPKPLSGKDKGDDEISIEFRDWKLWLIIGLLMSVLVVLWLQKSPLVITIRPPDKQEWSCNCHCEVPTCKEPIDFNLSNITYRYESWYMNLSRIQSERLPLWGVKQ